MNSVRLGWLHYHRTGKRLKSARAKDANPSRAEMKRAFTESGKMVALFLKESVEGTIAPRAFKKNGVRWMGYLIAHESRLCSH